MGLVVVAMVTVEREEEPGSTDGGSWGGASGFRARDAEGQTEMRKRRNR